MSEEMRTTKARSKGALAVVICQAVITLLVAIPAMTSDPPHWLGAAEQMSKLMVPEPPPSSTCLDSPY